MGTIMTVGLNPTLQKTLVFPKMIPDRVNRCAEHRFDVAGKALNVSRVLSQLGKKNRHLTPLGGTFRPVFTDLCVQDGLDIRWVESGSVIRFCYTIVDTEQRGTTELVEEGGRLEEGAESLFLESFNSLLPECSVLIISGSKAAGFSDAIIPEMVKRAKQSGLLVILDIRGLDLLNSLPFKPDLIKPNIDEFAATFAEGNTLDKDTTGSLCRTIWEQCGCRIVLTRGGHDIWYAESGKLEEFPVERVDGLNTTGSGDAFTAGLASALIDGASLREALAEGSRCGSLNALLLKPGTIV